ncbi:hypothetical protein WJX82_010526 [Trebouxia sp. C0006]
MAANDNTSLTTGLGESQHRTKRLDSGPLPGFDGKVGRLGKTARILSMARFARELNALSAGTLCLIVHRRDWSS